MHQPLIIFGVRAAAAAKASTSRNSAVVLIERMLFDAPAAIHPCSRTVRLAEALNKPLRWRARVVDHRIAQQ